MALSRRTFISGLLACPICASAAQAEGAKHWTYEGEEGPDKWAEVDPAFKACAVGAEQSPIDLKDAIPAHLDRLSLKWAPQAFKVANNGHTIQANAASGSSLMLGKEVYELKQFHFHGPSEHALRGERTAMEAHFVHAHASGRLAVVGVFIKPGKAHAGFHELMAAAPKEAGEAALAKPLDISKFLPAKRTMLRYEGSLTTPPCSEVVDWNVFDHGIEVAAADIAAFKALFPMNARPLQKLNRRYLLLGS